MNMSCAESVAAATARIRTDEDGDACLHGAAPGDGASVAGTRAGDARKMIARVAPAGNGGVD